MPTNRWVVFGHHFAAIAGPGPLVGPILAAQFGYLPGTLYILIGVVLGGAVQDFTILVASTRRDGKSLGQMMREEVGPIGGIAALVAILAILVILIAVLGLVVVNAMFGSPWATSTVAATIPIAIAMGIYLVRIRPGRVLEASLGGLALVILAVFAGRLVDASPDLRVWFDFDRRTLALLLVAYGFIASVLPVWLLLAPRDYLSAFVKIGTIALLAAGLLVVHPEVQLPALTSFIDGSGPIFAGKLFPFCFITIACGAISGFHSLIASGTTPKLLDRETDARFIGYGAMLMESFVAIMALLSAAVMEPGHLFRDQRALGVARRERADRRRGDSRLGLRLRARRLRAPHARGRRAHAALAHGRRALARRRHGGDLLAGPGRPRREGALVPLRDHVRGSLHPHHARRRHARRAAS